MTDELTKTFFDTFGIEPREKVNQTFNGAEFKIETIKDYPQITDRILLELIVVIMLHEDLYGYPRNVKDLKENVLKQLMETYNKFASSSYEYQQIAREIKHQVRTLFEEVNNDR